VTLERRSSTLKVFWCEQEVPKAASMAATIPNTALRPTPVQMLTPYLLVATYGTEEHAAKCAAVRNFVRTRLW
jgi:hypothetical protein